MKKFTFLLLVFIGFSLSTRAQFSVLLVDDDLNGTRESAVIETALTNYGVSFNTLLLDTVAPNFNDIKDYDLIIWTTANDGVDLFLWDTDDTTSAGLPILKFNDALMQYIDSGKVLWIDGLDFIYDVYGSAPDSFSVGDFLFDVMGISKYAVQSHIGDVVYDGVPHLLKSATNNITTLDTIKWKYSTLWYADGFELAPSAHPLYVMGPSDYDYYGYVSFLYNYNVITSTARIGAIGDGVSALIQADLDLLVSDIINATKNGVFAPKPNKIIPTNIMEKISIFPNPSNDFIICSGNISSEKITVKIYNNNSQLVLNEQFSDKEFRISIDQFKSGLYLVEFYVNGLRSTHKIVVE